MTSRPDVWDAIVIGSGIGGLACGAALARTGHAVLVLEQHYVAGGLTQTFHRSGFRWDVGVHYLGEMGPDGEVLPILNWLSGGTIKFAAMDPVYDIVHFPGNFVVHFERPQAELQRELDDKFPDSKNEIIAFFTALADAQATTRKIFTLRAMPAVLARMYGFWHRAEIRKWWGRTSAEVLDELVSDPKLRAVLLAQRGNYGGTVPAQMSFGVQALVLHHYFKGAYYPVGGAKVFADALVPVIEQGGGAIKLRAKVRELMVESGTVVGVRLDDGAEFRARRVFSDAGARNTVELMPSDMRRGEWAQEILSFAPSVCHLALYLGLEGDIRSKGASSSNYWFHETWDIGPGVWLDPIAEPSAPGLFVSFPSLKDPTHNPGDKQRHTAEIVTTTTWDAFSRWQNSTRRNRPADYAAFKSAIEDKLLAQFARYFPALAPMIVVHELSTPLTTVSFTGAQQGAIYGLEVSPRRFLSESLRAKTPVPGLFLTGQDVVTPGVTGAMMGGLFAAAAIEPQVYKHLR